MDADPTAASSTVDRHLPRGPQARRPPRGGVRPRRLVLMLGVDLVNFPKFPIGCGRASPSPSRLDTAAGRRRLRRESWPTTAVRTGPTCGSRRLGRARSPRRSSRRARRTCSPASTAGPVRSPSASAKPRCARSSGRRGPARIAPELERMKDEFLRTGTADEAQPAVAVEDRDHHAGRLHRAVHPGSRRGRPLEGAARHVVPREPRVPPPVHRGVGPTQIVLRTGLDDMFDIQYTLWRQRRAAPREGAQGQYLGITGDTVEDWMKDLQLDATALPGKAFDLTFELPEPEVGIMTFNRWCRGRSVGGRRVGPTSCEKNCRSTCPQSDERQRRGCTTRACWPTSVRDGTRSRTATCAAKGSVSMRDDERPGVRPRRARAEAEARLTQPLQ